MATSVEKNDIQYVDDKADSVYAPKQHQMVQIDNVQVLGLDPADADFYINFSEEKRKKVIHKVRRSLCEVHDLERNLTIVRSTFGSCPCWQCFTLSRTLTAPTSE